MSNQEYLGYQDKPGNQDSKCNKRNCESKENQGKKVYQGKPKIKETWAISLKHYAICCTSGQV